jgi:hypothetical protein
MEDVFCPLAGIVLISACFIYKLNGTRWSDIGYLDPILRSGVEYTTSRLHCSDAHPAKGVEAKGNSMLLVLHAVCCLILI